MDLERRKAHERERPETDPPTRRERDIEERTMFIDGLKWSGEEWKQINRINEWVTAEEDRAAEYIFWLEETLKEWIDDAMDMDIRIRRG